MFLHVCQFIEEAAWDAPAAALLTRPRKFFGLRVLLSPLFQTVTGVEQGAVRRTRSVGDAPARVARRQTRFSVLSSRLFVTNPRGAGQDLVPPDELPKQGKQGKTVSGTFLVD